MAPPGPQSCSDRLTNDLIPLPVWPYLGFNQMVPARRSEGIKTAAQALTMEHLKVYGHPVSCSDLDWLLRTLHLATLDLLPILSLTVGVSVSRIWSLFDGAQIFKCLVNLFGYTYSLLLTRVLLKTARQTSSLVIKLGSGLSGFLLDIAE